MSCDASDLDELLLELSHMPTNLIPPSMYVIYKADAIDVQDEVISAHAWFSRSPIGDKWVER